MTRQEPMPQVAETSLHGRSKYYGDYPAGILLSLRKYPEGRSRKALAGDLGAEGGDLPALDVALGDLVDLGIVERVDRNKETLWRVARWAKLQTP